MRDFRRAIAATATLLLGACAHNWPAESRGGMAERDRSQDSSLQEAADTIDFLKTNPGRQSPAELVVAELDVIRARRERAGGLDRDADESQLRALIALGGSPEIPTARPTCLKQPCEMAK